MEKALSTTRSDQTWYSILTEFGYDRTPCKILSLDGVYYTIEYFDNVKGEPVTEKVLTKFVK